MYSHQRHCGRYCAIYICRMAEKQVPNLSEPLEFMVFEQKSRLCKIKRVPSGHLGNFCHRSLRCYSSRLFNALLIHFRNLIKRSTSVFKKYFDIFLKTVIDNPCIPNDNNSLYSRLTDVHNVLSQKTNKASSEFTQGIYLI